MMVEIDERLSPIKRILYWLGFDNFRWFRRWVGGHWYQSCSLGYALCRGLMQKQGVYITKNFDVILWEEHYAPYSSETEESIWED